MAKDLVQVEKRSLTAAQYGDLAEVPPELEWLANITNPKTRRAYKIDMSEFSAFAGLSGPAELRTVTRAHVIAWRKDLERLAGVSDLPGRAQPHPHVAGQQVRGLHGFQRLDVTLVERSGPRSCICHLCWIDADGILAGKLAFS